MQVYETAQETVDHAETLTNDRQRTLARLDELLRLRRELLDNPSAEPPLTPPMLRRVIFAAWCDAVAAGAKAEADHLLLDIAQPEALSER